jgi:hypothetical protein
VVFSAGALVAYRFLLPGPEDAERLPASDHARAGAPGPAEGAASPGGRRSC